MKKLLFITVILSGLFFTSCNKYNKGGEYKLSKYAGFKEVDRTLSLQMIDHYINSPLVDHTIANSIWRINLTREDKRWMINDKKTIEIVYFFAAYLPNYSDGSMVNKPTVLLQLKKANKDKTDSSYIYYDIRLPLNSLSSLRTKPPICPPPPCVAPES